MNIWMTRLFVFVYPFTAAYLLGCFIEADFNVTNWTGVIQTMCAVMAVTTCYVLTKTIFK